MLGRIQTKSQTDYRFEGPKMVASDGAQKWFS